MSERRRFSINESFSSIRITLQSKIETYLGFFRSWAEADDQSVKNLGSDRLVNKLDRVGGSSVDKVARGDQKRTVRSDQYRAVL